jgi:DNA-binding NarL/FixJ family response regulator
MKRTFGKVMLVEDDDFTRKTIKESLMQSGIEIVHDTNTVIDAINFAKKYLPDIAIVDYNLGNGPNGIDLANQLRKMQPEIGIILLTAYLDPMQLASKVLLLPPGSRYISKHDVTDIAVLISEIVELS